MANAANQSDVTQPIIEIESKEIDETYVAVTVSVEDDGAGLTGDILEQIQRRLSQETEQLKAEFSSLLAQAEHGKGLALCQLWLKAVDSHLDIGQGKNRVRNRFSFTIKVKRRQPNDVSFSINEAILRDRGPVLLVEDNLVWSSILSQRLLEWGCVPLTLCHRGEHAIDLIQDGRFALVLMDIRLSGELDGYEIVKQIRANTTDRSQLPRLISISITEDDAEKRDEAGFDGFIRKDKLVSTRDLFKVWFPDEPLPEAAFESPTESVEAELTSWIEHLDESQALKLLNELTVILSLIDLWGMHDPRTQKAMHDWEKIWRFETEDLAKALKQAESTINATEQVGNLVGQLVDEIQARHGIW